VEETESLDDFTAPPDSDVVVSFGSSFIHPNSATRTESDRAAVEVNRFFLIVSM
jgi:hypothetical protein